MDKRNIVYSNQIRYHLNSTFIFVYKSGYNKMKKGQSNRRHNRVIILTNNGILAK